MSRPAHESDMATELQLAAQRHELILEYQIKEFLRLQATAAESQGGTQRVRFRRIHVVVYFEAVGYAVLRVGRLGFEDY